MKIFFNSSLFLSLCLLLISACEEDLIIKPPAVSYASKTIRANFNEPGSSTIPSINWNGEKGVFSISKNIPGIDINKDNGQITWSNILPYGIHHVEIVASNSGGQTINNIKIENPLVGTFQGYLPYYDATLFVTFFENNKMNLKVSRKDDLNDFIPFIKGEGDFFEDADNIICNFDIININTNDIQSKASLKGIILHKEVTVMFSGKWFEGYGALENKFSGIVFNISMN